MFLMKEFRPCCQSEQRGIILLFTIAPLSSILSRVSWQLYKPQKTVLNQKEGAAHRTESSLIYTYIHASVMYRLFFHNLKKPSREFGAPTLPTVMLFGLVTQALRKGQEAELEVTEMKMWRFSLGKMTIGLNEECCCSHPCTEQQRWKKKSFRLHANIIKPS